METFCTDFWEKTESNNDEKSYTEVKYRPIWADPGLQYSWSCSCHRETRNVAKHLQNAMYTAWNRSVGWTIIVPHALGDRLGPTSNGSSQVSESGPNCQLCCTSLMSSLNIHFYFANRQHKQRKRRRKSTVNEKSWSSLTSNTNHN